MIYLNSFYRASQRKYLISFFFFLIEGYQQVIHEIPFLKVVFIDHNTLSICFQVVTVPLVMRPSIVRLRLTMKSSSISMASILLMVSLFSC